MIPVAEGLEGVAAAELMAAPPVIAVVASKGRSSSNRTSAEFQEIIALVHSKEAFGCGPSDIKWTEIGNEVAAKLTSATRKGTNIRDWVDDAKKVVKSCQSEYSTTEGCLLGFPRFSPGGFFGVGRQLVVRGAEIYGFKSSASSTISHEYM